MSRSGYSDDLDQPDLAMWRGRVASAIRGKRGQRMLRELRDALDAMPEKRLVARALEKDGQVCTLGALTRSKGLSFPEPDFDTEFNGPLASALDVAECLIQEIEWENDEVVDDASPEHRWKRMRSWVETQIK